jgi:hypothetical protein
MSRMTKRTLPCVNCLKIDTVTLLKIECTCMSVISYSSDSIFHEDYKSAIRIDMRSLVLYLLKIEITDKSPRKRYKRLRMSQGSILHTQNPDLRPRVQPAKNRKLLHVVLKSAIRLKIMQGPTL